MQRLLVANRGEAAGRIVRGALAYGLTPVTVYSRDDADAPFNNLAPVAMALPGRGPAAYLDIPAIIAAAREARADALHPGWGFLSESAALAEACAAAGLTFIGPSPALLTVFGDKLRARKLAVAAKVPVARSAATLSTARGVLLQGPVMVKAAAGGGGRGMRLVRDARELEAAWQHCAAEAGAAFGDSRVFAEAYIEDARHIEIQIAGDGGAELALGTRECSLQRRHQKLLEFAPAPGNATQIAVLTEAALRMARAAGYSGLGTWEFLVSGDKFWFLEVNPRLQVEHTVTEAVTGLDLVQLQFHLAAGGSLAGLNLPVPVPAEGVALQLRINAERLDENGKVWPATGTIKVFEPPTGPGIRVDHALAAGYTPSIAFDSLLAKLIVHAPAREVLFERAAAALAAFRIEGLATNISTLTALIEMAEVITGEVHTGFIDAHAAALAPPPPPPAQAVAVAGRIAIIAPMNGVLVKLDAAPGDVILPGETAALVEAMKMQVPVTPDLPVRVHEVLAEAGAPVQQGDPILIVEPVSVDAPPAEAAAPAAAPAEGPAEGPAAALAAAPAAAPAATLADAGVIRPDLAEFFLRRHATTDAGRPAAIARRHAQGRRSIRENLAALLDPGTFIEYGALAVAAQRRRRSLDDLISLTPADGLIAGIGRVNGHDTAILAYDYTVLAGTQGFIGHKKTDRLLALALAHRLPVVLFAEGGGGRPGDTDVMAVAGLDLTTFARFARLSGQVPVVGIAAGYCFAGNAALLGCCDTIIAAPNASIGMGGPAMIDGGGLGIFRPEEVGPAAVQTANGVIDILAHDEAEAVAAAKTYLGYFNETTSPFIAEDQHGLRAIVPEDRKRAYDMRALINLLADTGTVLELRAGFAPGMITALLRLGGRPMGVIANNPLHLGGAINADGADKAARFMRLCNAHGLPILSLCDTPGFMVGPQAEAAAQVRHVSRMFVAGAALEVPLFCVVPRKGYGLGAMAMAGGGFHETVFTAAWPSGEFGGMGLEGAVRLGYKRELEAEADPDSRQALFETLVANLYAEGKAINMESYLEIDAVIDPADTRGWIARGLSAAKPGPRGHAQFIDTW
jgi:acetyl/propionyl-CoA carboxylase alpha subunit/acetyl-CoA carboxylase carboxyltransferase component